MRQQIAFATLLLIGSFAAESVAAACTGSNGRGWASGKGVGRFEMTTADGTCRMGFPGFTFSDGRPRVPATELVLTQAPKSGKITLHSEGLIYTPNRGFKGEDRFCTRNTTPRMPGKTLSGCITVAVR